MDRMIQPPEYAGLINPIICNAFPMRYERREDVIESVLVATGEEAAGIPIDVEVYRDTALPVCDALLCIAPFVRLAVPVRASYAGRLMLARLRFELDGEVLVNGEPLDRFLVAPPCRIESKEDDADPYVVMGRDEADLVGSCRLHFAPDKSRLLVRVNGIPRGAGDIRLIVGVVAARYTTKARQGCLFDFGLLDESQQCYPSRFGWPRPEPKTIPQEKFEEAHATALAAKLRETEEELRLAKEDALRRKNSVEASQAARQKLAEIQARIAAPPKPPCEPPKGPDIVDGGTVMVSFDEGLERAKRRLMTWGLVGTLALVAVGALILGAAHFLRGL